MFERSGEASDPFKPRDLDATIVRVQPWVVRAPLDPAWKIATTVFNQITAVFVEVELACGAVGWGEGLVRVAPGSATALIKEYLGPLVIGRDAHNIQAIWDDMYGMFRSRGHSRGIALEAIAGIDIALWDALGNAEGRSIGSMLMGYGRTQVPCYASSVMIGDKNAIVLELERLIDEGYRAIKLKVGRNVVEDAERVEIARGIAGDQVEIMVDVNGSWNLDQAADFVRRTRDFKLSWIEEPLVADDLSGYRRLATMYPEVPLAAGEAEFTSAGYREFCESRLFTVWQPDVARAGGITGFTRIAWLAHAYNIDIAPHVGASAGICAAASVQLAAAIPNFRIYEHMYLDHDLQDVFVEGSICARDSAISVPTGPGLGLSVDTAKIDRLKQ